MTYKSLYTESGTQSTRERRLKEILPLVLLKTRFIGATKDPYQCVHWGLRLNTTGVLINFNPVVWGEVHRPGRWCIDQKDDPAYFEKTSYPNVHATEINSPIIEIEPIIQKVQVPMRAKLSESFATMLIPCLFVCSCCCLLMGASPLGRTSSTWIYDWILTYNASNCKWNLVSVPFVSVWEKKQNCRVGCGGYIKRTSWTCVSNRPLDHPSSRLGSLILDPNLVQSSFISAPMSESPTASPASTFQAPDPDKEAYPPQTTGTLQNPEQPTFEGGWRGIATVFGR